MDWTNEQIQAIWEKAIPIPGHSKNEVRMDACGAIIIFKEFTKDKVSFSQYSWTFDIIKPIEKGGEFELINLRPLHTQNAASKGDNYPIWKGIKTHMTSDDGEIMILNINQDVNMNETPDVWSEDDVYF
ncbi:hypothetical protein [Spiroplasma endosymbiont of Labia minor]|uniref:hypothetical protein n=1 Tax=Spiroplasma endosymbiont of Labia minor TaxID=3066305 RepID=UPI0030D29631